MDDTTILLLLVGLYFGFIFILGVSKYREIKNTDDFLVAGRNTHWFMMLATMSATVVGGGMALGAVGKTYDWGVIMVVISLGLYLHFIFAGIWIAPAFRKLRVYTVAQFIGHHFGEGPRVITLILSVLFSVGVIGAQMAAVGNILGAILAGSVENLSTIITWSVVIGGTLVVIYSTAGGLKAVIFTDLFQFLILIAGFMFTVFFIVDPLNMKWIPTDWEAIQLSVPEGFWDFSSKGVLWLISMVLLFMFGEMFGPGYATRFVSGRDIRHTKIGITGAGIFLSLTLPFILIPIAMYGHYLGLGPDVSHDQVLPRVIAALHNPWIGGIIIAALLSAVMSSSDTALNSSAAIFIKDVLERYFHIYDENGKRQLKISRIYTLCMGAVAILVAALWPDVLGLIVFAYEIWAPGIIMPVVLGVFVKKKSDALSQAVFLGMILATIGSFIYRETIWATYFNTAPAGMIIAFGSALIMWALFSKFPSLVFIGHLQPKK
jgi:solute:Na+ symporter, SSS family